MMFETIMLSESILPLVVEYRRKAKCTYHAYSKGEASEAIPCSDRMVKDFIVALENQEAVVSLIISDIHWIESGGCVGDKLYPVILKATRIPESRYFLELASFRETREFVLSYDKE